MNRRLNSTILDSYHYGTIIIVSCLLPLICSEHHRHKHLCMTSSDVEVKLRALANLVQTAKNRNICSGKQNALICNEADFKILANSSGLQSLLHQSTINSKAYLEKIRSTMKINPTPWLSVGEAQWYGNDYLDFFMYETFFHPTFGISDGVYIETGGSNGVHASNTLFFDHYFNWTGLLIEPTPCATCMLPFNRPRARIVRGGICQNETMTEFSSMYEFCAGYQSSCEPKWNPVRCAPIRSYAVENKITNVDFFSIDVEEYYMAVLNSWDWRIKPAVILIECSKTDCWEFLKAQGYTILEAAKFGIKGLEIDTVAWRNHESCSTIAGTIFSNSSKESDDGLVSKISLNVSADPFDQKDDFKYIWMLAIIVFFLILIGFYRAFTWFPYTLRAASVYFHGCLRAVLRSPMAFFTEVRGDLDSPLRLDDAWALIKDTKRFNERGVGYMQKLLEELDVDKATDLEFLSENSIRQIAELLKEVPTGKFLKFMNLK